MSVGKAGEGLVFQRKFRKIFKHLRRFFHNYLGSAAEYNYIGIITDIAACSAQMNYGFCLRALHAECVNMRHYIMPNLFFARLGDIVINIVLIGFHFGYLFIGNVQPQLFFGFGKRYPQFTPSAEFKVFRKNMLHFVGSIAG